MKFSPYFSKASTYIRKNYLLVAIVAVVGVILTIAFIKYLMKDKEVVYAKIKVSQGLWWANTLKPSIWMVDAIQKGDSEKNLSGKPVVLITEVRSYPVSGWPAGQHDVFLTVKMSVDKNDRTGTYTFKRSPLVVGAPVDLNLTKVQLSGTVVALSEKPFNEKKTAKIVTLEKKFVKPSEYEMIKIGDTYFDGVENIVEVIDKSYSYSYETYNSIGNSYPVEAERDYNVIVQLKMLVNDTQKIPVFHEELPLVSGREVDIFTSNTLLDQYIIQNIK